MHWKQLDPVNKPEDQVLAKDKDGDMIVGYIFGNTCGNGDLGSYLDNITHYILVSDLARLHNELRP